METLSGNYISLLNEYQQKTQFTVEYEEGSTDGPTHNKTFSVCAVVNGQRYPAGTGKTKKEARQNAAKNALNGMKETQTTETTASLTQSISTSAIITWCNYTCWLNEYAQKNKLVFKAHESTTMDPGNTTQLCIYVCKFVCGEKEYPEAKGNTKKEAKEAAAQLVHQEHCRTQNTEVFNEDCNSASRPEVSSLSANMECLNLRCSEDSQSATPDSNYIAILNMHCQKYKHVLDFKLVDRRGPPHNPEFVYKAVIDGKEFSEGQGKNAKAAKQQAAQRAWSELQESGGNIKSCEDDSSSLASVKSVCEVGQQSPNSSAETFSTSDSVIFKDPSSVSSLTSSSPAVSPLNVKAKKKLAPNFHLSPTTRSKEKSRLIRPGNIFPVFNCPILDGPDMNDHSSAKPPGNQIPVQAIKSRFLEDFHSIEPIGKGGFGRVFKAKRNLEDQFYAVKIVKSTEKARREVSALAKLTNPNIVRYYTSWFEDTAYRHDSSESISDSGSGPGTKFLYIQMELCEGDTLRAWIEERNTSNKQFPKRRQDAAHITWQILQAVKYIHHKGLIHRDLKPPNIMFNSEGGVKVGDFGLVTEADNDNDGGLLERTKRTGTRSYMSPEQATQTYDRKVDIFALGLIYFELVWSLFTASEKQKIWNDIRSKKFPPHFSEKYDFEHKLIDRMLCQNPDDRPDATEMDKELGQYSKHLENGLKADQNNKTEI